MKFVFASNYLNHHQRPFCDEMYRVLGENFSFISNEEMDSERKEMGWKNESVEYEVCAWKNQEEMNYAQKLINEADILMIGSAPDSLFIERLHNGKIVIRYAERFYKEKMTMRRWIHALIGTWIHHGRFQRYPIYMLCASAYTAVDCARFGNYKNRMYKWGYFPKTFHYNLDELFSNKDSRKILWIGRMLEWKHPDYALMVAKRLKDDGYDFTMEIGGMGELENDLRVKSETLKLTDCVHFLGAIPSDKVRSYMENAGIYLFTSDRREGWGAVLNEAMNSGCAVVACDAIGSVPFLIENNKNGLVYHSKEVDQLYENVKYLLDRKEEQRRLGKKAYKTCIREWNAQVASERLITVCRNLLANKDVENLYNIGPCSKATIINDE